METVADNVHDHTVFAVQDKARMKFLEKKISQFLYYPYGQYATVLRFQQRPRLSCFNEDVKYWYSEKQKN